MCRSLSKIVWENPLHATVTDRAVHCGSNRTLITSWHLQARPFSYCHFGVYNDIILHIPLCLASCNQTVQCRISLVLPGSNTSTYYTSKSPVSQPLVRYDDICTSVHLNLCLKLTNSACSICTAHYLTFNALSLLPMESIDSVNRSTR